MNYKNVGLLIALIGTVSSQPTADEQFYRNSAAFATNLYHRSTVGRNYENVMLSPLSIETSLALLLMGANGQTEQELRTGIGVGGSDKTLIAEHFNKMLAQQNNDPNLSILNKIYIKSGYQATPKFNEIARTKFNSESQDLDFSRNVESAKIINNWVEQATNHKIKDLIKAEDLDSLTAMVLVNAIYFNKEWVNKFTRQFTRDYNFWLNNTTSVQIPMMLGQMTILKKYSPELKATAIQLPYKNTDIFMMIILPDEKDGLDYLESRLPGVNLLDLASNMESQHYDTILIPKFKIEFSVQLNDILTQLGMGTMFTHNADFRNLIQQTTPLQVSKVVHKTFVDVNEEGAEAAAATGSIVVDRCCTKDFFADRPFMFAIMNQKSILLLGRFKNPRTQ